MCLPFPGFCPAPTLDYCSYSSRANAQYHPTSATELDSIRRCQPRCHGKTQACIAVNGAELESAYGNAKRGETDISHPRRCRRTLKR